MMKEVVEEKSVEVSVRVGYKGCAGRGGTGLDEGAEMGQIEGQIGPR